MTGDFPSMLHDAIRAGEFTEYSTIHVTLPGGDVPIHESAARLGHVLGGQLTHFVRGGVVVKTQADGSDRPVRSEELSGTFGQLAQLTIRKEAYGRIEDKPAVCSTATAKQIMASDEFLRRLPRLNVVSRCPVLIERDGALVPITSYDRASGILASGQRPAEMTVDGARDALTGLTC